MLTLVAALPQETNPCLKTLDLQEVIARDGFQVARVTNHHTEFLLAHGRTGEPAVATAQQAMQYFDVTGIISFGLAGGTSPLAARGDLVVATEISQAVGAGKPLATDPKLQHRLMEAARQSGASCHTGPMVTVGKVIATPQEKAFIGSQHRALGLDMESYWLARFAAEHKLPFGVVRAIFDPVEMGLDLPPEIGTNFKALLKYPKLWPSLPKWARHLHLASRNLQGFLTRL